MNEQPDTEDLVLSQQGHEPMEGVESSAPRVIREVGNFKQTLYTWRPADPEIRSSKALVYLHGGGFQNGDPTGAGNIGKYLALKLGMTTFSVSYRLATPQCPSYPKPLEDVAAAWEWIRSHASEWGVDPELIAIGGESAGGGLATLALTTGRLPGTAALVNYWGPIDFVARWFDRGETPGAEATLLGCTYDENPSMYHQASALTYVRSGLPPGLFIYGRQDTIVHARQGRLGHAAWQSVHSHSECYVYPNVGHGVVGDGREDRRRVLVKTREFLNARMGVEYN